MARRRAISPPPSQALKPTALVGVSTNPGAFNESIVRAMSSFNEWPVISCCRTRTSHRSATAEQAYRWSDGRAAFMSGSPFDPVTLGGKTSLPGQGNNSYIFLARDWRRTRASRVPDTMFLAAAETLAGAVSEAALAEGRLVPSLSDIRRVSHRIAVEVAEVAYREGLAREPRPADLPGTIEGLMYDGTYPDYLGS
ncbi:MAG: malic enzyme-like NAD(P)-binding protein [Gemmatimonadales bacterium]